MAASVDVAIVGSTSKACRELVDPEAEPKRIYEGS